MRNLLLTTEKIMLKSKSLPYEKLAVIYNHIMRSVHYDKWAEYIHEVVDDYVEKKIAVLELGAGSGKFAHYFRKFYPNLILSDLSFYMLNNSLKIPKVVCNMSSLPFKIEFGLIYSTFDSVNYLLSKKALLKLFKEVSLVLSSKGVFTFDASLEKNSIKHSKIPLRSGEYKGVNFTQKSHYFKSGRIHKNVFKIHLQNGEQFTEVHKQKIYPFEIYFELLDKAGLYVVECLEAFSFNTGSANSERVQFVVKKVNK